MFYPYKIQSLVSFLLHSIHSPNFLPNLIFGRPSFQPAESNRRHSHQALDKLRQLKDCPGAKRSGHQAIVERALLFFYMGLVPFMGGGVCRQPPLASEKEQKNNWRDRTPIEATRHCYLRSSNKKRISVR